MRRVESIDLVRGLMMILMALDHVRDLMHITSITQSPTDLATTTPVLFFTRWMTHLCAPAFVTLSGASAWLSTRNKNGAVVRNHLLQKGLSLILLDFTLVNFGVWFDLHFDVFLFDVLSAIGFGLIALALLLKCTVRTIAATGLIIICLHNLTGFMPPPASLSMPARFVLALFRPDVFSISVGKILIIGYPPLPWVGILLLGFAGGSLFRLPVEQRKPLFMKGGLLAIGVFALLRGLNMYGDSTPWSVQRTDLFTFLSFINVTKYPPSLQFTLLFVGFTFVLLSLADGLGNRVTAVLSTYGRVPLFYFLIHWYLIHPLVFLMDWLQGYKAADMVFGTNFGRPASGGGLHLWAIYLVWMGIVVILYPLCKWYGNYKEAHREKVWLRFL